MIESHSQKSLANQVDFVDDELPTDDENFEFPSDQRYEEIKKGELRLKANLGSGNYPYCYHLDCFLQHYKITVEELLDVYLKRLNPSRKDSIGKI